MRKVMSLAGAAVLVAALGAPALAGGCEEPPPCDGGIQISIGVAALDGHLLGQYLPAPVGVKKVTICHTTQDHSADYWIGWVTPSPA